MLVLENVFLYKLTQTQEINHSKRTIFPFTVIDFLRNVYLADL